MDRQATQVTKWVTLASVLILIGFVLPWLKPGMINPATRQPLPPRFGWTQTIAWLALLDAILLAVLPRLDVVGKQIFGRDAIGAALGALCVYIGLIGVSGTGASAGLWWPAFLVSLGLVGTGLAPEEAVPAQARLYINLVGMAVVVGLLAAIAMKAFTIGQMPIVVGGFVAYLVNVARAKEHYPEFRRLREEEAQRSGPGI